MSNNLGSMQIKEFLASNPSIPDILKYVDEQASRIVKEKLKSNLPGEKI